MNFDGITELLMVGTSLVALGVGLVTLTSVVMLRSFIREEIAQAISKVRADLDAVQGFVTENREALASHIEAHHVRT